MADEKTENRRLPQRRRNQKDQDNSIDRRKYDRRALLSKPELKMLLEE